MATLVLVLIVFPFVSMLIEVRLAPEILLRYDVASLGLQFALGTAKYELQMVCGGTFDSLRQLF